MSRKFSTSMVILAIMTVLFACNSKNRPDVSHINVSVEVQHFDDAVFSLDTTHPRESLLALQEKFPGFTSEFSNYILGIGPVSDTMPPQTVEAFLFFIDNYRPVYDTLRGIKKSWPDVEEELKESFRYLKYYFPQWEVPPIVTYLGPFDAPGVAFTESAMAIGWQLFAGKDFFYYQTMQGQEMYPNYVSRRFEPAYIPVNAVKAILDDLYPPARETGSMIRQMVAGGKQWHVLDQVLANNSDSLITGYTGSQLEFCERNEAAIWNLILKTADIYTREPELIRLYLGEAPSTQGLPETAPGNIGQYIGWRIVRKYMEKFPETDMKTLMEKDGAEIFAESGYKPR